MASIILNFDAEHISWRPTCDVTWDLAARALLGCLGSVLEQTVSAAPPDDRPRLREELVQEMNLAFTNFLNNHSDTPCGGKGKDLSSEIILALENQVILYASDHGLSLKEATENVEAILETILAEPG